jgi:RNA polymerase sigma-70 factor (ECF subfamily)
MRARNQDDQEAWLELADYYKPFIFGLFYRMNIPQSEHDDLCQDVLLRLWKHLSKYDSDRAKFRTWFTVTAKNAIFTHMSLIKKRKDRLSDYQEEILNNKYLVEGAENDFEELVQKEWEVYLTNRALKNLEGLFSGKAIDVFNRALKGENAEEIANALDIRSSSVYTLKNRVKDRLIEEIARLKTEVGG